MVKIRKLEKQWTTGNERLSIVNPTKTESVNSVFKTGVHYLHYVMLRVQNVRSQVIFDSVFVFFEFFNLFLKQLTKNNK